MDIIIQSGPERGRRFTIQGTNAIIGRQSQCDVCLQDERLSSQHAQLRYKNGYWYISDLTSRNGTWVNCQRLYQEHMLQPSDEIGVGKTVMRCEGMGMAGGAVVAYPMYDNGPAYNDGPTDMDGWGAAVQNAATPMDTLGLVLDIGLIMSALSIIIGTFLPWITVTAFFIIETEIKGIDYNEGKIVIFGGAISLLLALTTLFLRISFRTATITPLYKKLYLANIYHLLLSSGIVGTWVYAMITINNAMGETAFFGIPVGALADVEAEIGLYFVVIGVMTMFLTSMGHLLQGLLNKNKF